MCGTTALYDMTSLENRQKYSNSSGSSSARLVCHGNDDIFMPIPSVRQKVDMCESPQRKIVKPAERVSLRRKVSITRRGLYGSWALVGQGNSGPAVGIHFGGTSSKQVHRCTAYGCRLLAYDINRRAETKRSFEPQQKSQLTLGCTEHSRSPHLARCYKSVQQ